MMINHPNDPPIDTDELSAHAEAILTLIATSCDFVNLRRIAIILDTATMPFNGSPTAIDSINYALSELGYTNRLRS